MTELSRERTIGFPGFDKDHFEKLSDEDWKRFNDQTCQVHRHRRQRGLRGERAARRGVGTGRPQLTSDWWAGQSDPAQPYGRVGRSTAGAEYPPAASTPTADLSESQPHRRARRKRPARREPIRARTSTGVRGRAMCSASRPGANAPAIGVTTAEDENKRRQARERATPSGRRRTETCHLRSHGHRRLALQSPIFRRSADRSSMARSSSQ